MLDSANVRASVRKAPRVLYGGVGLLCVGLGTVGLFVPVWPSTIFFILALWAFKRSSARLENWLLNHRAAGPTLRDWDQNRWIRKRTKAVAVSLLWVCLITTILLVRSPTATWVLGAVGLGVSGYVLTRRTKPEVDLAPAPSVAHPADFLGS